MFQKAWAGVFWAGLAQNKDEPVLAEFALPKAVAKPCHQGGLLRVLRQLQHLVGGYNELVVPMAHGFWPGMLHILKVTRFQTGLAIY